MAENNNKQNGVEQVIPGATESTPSRPQYFSWINNTNEGSTEAQTLTNLAYFGWLKEAYGMQLDIYAWDAGNLDGSRETYQSERSEKIRAQYPHGYAPVVQAAEKYGIRMGVWCGPDGFGNTPQEAEKRKEQMVSLCRDYHFALFKMDGVCGRLRDEVQDVFVDMMTQCRTYSPDLILLNHRLDLGKGNPYATTFLWNGQETYVDIMLGNTMTAPHNRAYLFFRGNVPGLQRLSEDHGVCISSCVDYFEDELIYQAFGRCLILAPEIYGNPWLLRDDEQAHLARIYNLHRTYRDILVNGIYLPQETYGSNAVSRGSEKIRFITTGNPHWERRCVTINLNEEIGLTRCEKVVVSTHHPYERMIGVYEYGDRVSVEMDAFRACLIKVCDAAAAEPMLQGCEYQVLHETEGTVDRVRVLHVFDSVSRSDGGAVPPALAQAEPFDHTIAPPCRLGELEPCDVPENAEQLFETARFVMNMDSMEARELQRAGKTAVPQVQAARDAFFEQENYRLRGCESRFAFDGKEDTFFDGLSRTPGEWMRRDGGCLRVDFGSVFEADEILIEYFDIDQSMSRETLRQEITPRGDVSADLAVWHDVTVEEVRVLREENARIVMESVHNIEQRPGKRKQVTYGVKGIPLRYFRLPSPLDRIYKIALRRDGKELALEHPHVNNLLPSYRNGAQVCAARTATFKVTEELWREECYLAAGINGKHGSECAYVVATVDGVPVGFPRRAPSYPANVWECPAHFAMNADGYYTYYLPVSRDMVGKEIVLTAIFCDTAHTDVPVEVYLCDANNEKKGIDLDLTL